MERRKKTALGTAIGTPTGALIGVLIGLALGLIVGGYLGYSSIPSNWGSGGRAGGDGALLVLLIPVFCVLVGVIIGGVLGALGGGILGALIGGVLGTGIGAACETGPDPAKSAPEEHNALGSEGPSQPAAGLTAFWIVPPPSPGLLGFGVTSRSLDDALRIICALGYGSHLPDDLNDLRVTEGVKVAELDQSHVVANMGPIVVRGMWYPFVAVGVPEWVDA